MLFRSYYSGSYFFQRLENDTPIGLEFYNGRLVWYRYSYLCEDVDRQLQYVILGANGHLRGYVWKEQSSEWDKLLPSGMWQLRYLQKCPV